MRQPKNPSTCGGCALTAILISLGSFFLIAIASWLSFQASERRIASKVKQTLQSLRDRGVPVDDASLDQYYKTNTVADDSESWCRILDYLVSKEFNALAVGVEEFDASAAETGPQSSGWPSEHRYRELTAATEELRSEIHTLAAKRNAVRFPIRFDSVGTPLPYTQNIRSASRLISVEFEVALADGISSKIRQAIETQLNLSYVCSREPMIVSKLVCVAVQGVALQNLKRAIEKNRLQPDDLKQLLSQLQSTPKRTDSWSEAMQGERALMLPVFDRPFGQIMGDQKRDRNFGLLNRASHQDKLNYLSILERIESIDHSSPRSFLAATQEFETSVQASTDRAGILGARNWIYTRSCLPAFAAVSTAFIRDDTRVVQCKLAIGIRLYQFEKGKLPDRLEQLSEIGIDASQLESNEGKPYGYRRTGKTAKLWGPMMSIHGTIKPTGDHPPEPDLGADSNSYETYQIEESLWIFGE